MLRRFGLTEDQAKINIRDDESHMILAKIADEIVDWRNFAPYLGLTPQDVSVIARDMTLSEDAKKKAMMEKWNKKPNVNATYFNLIKACVEAQDKQLAECVCQLLKGI